MSDQEEARLRALLQGVLWDNRKGGLFITQVPGAKGCYVFSMTADMQHRPPTGAELKAIEEKLPKIGSLARQAARSRKAKNVSQETLLRAQMLEDFLKDHTKVVSIDPAKQIPASSQVTALDRSTLPKGYMGVDRQAGVLNIQLSEFPMKSVTGQGTLRPDAFLFQLDLEPHHIKELDGGKSPLDLLKDHTFENPRAMYFDDNLPESGKRAKVHHEKSIETMKSAVAWVFEQTGLKTTGALHLSVTDQWRDHAVLQVGGSGEQRWRRDIDPTTGKEVKKSSKNHFFAWGTYSLEIDAKGKRILTLIDKDIKFMDGMKSMEGEIKKIWQQTDKAMISVFKKMK